MISIDTNVLLRYLLADNEEQHAKAKAVLRGQQPVLVTDVVLVETVWTLSGKRYSLDKAQICRVLRGLVEDSVFRFESCQVVWSALMNFEASKPVDGKELDFADCLIAQKSIYIAEGEQRKLRAFYSFDKAVAQLKGSKTP